MLLALDPSVRSPGAAVFLNGTLLAARRVRLTPLHDAVTDGKRWLTIARDILQWSKDHGAGMIEEITEVVFEKPQIYRASKSKGDPNGLLGLVGVSMALVGLLDARQGVPLRVISPSPAEWCGQIPKSTTGSVKASPRALRILSRLSDAEKLIVPDQHDAIDAVGLGLHALGRLGIKRVFSSGGPK